MNSLQLLNITWFVGQTNAYNNVDLKN